MWGKPYQELGPEQRLALLGYDKLRTTEDTEIEISKVKASAGRIF